MRQLPLVTEALMVNGPGAEKRVSVLQGEHHYKYERTGEPSPNTMFALGA